MFKSTLFVILAICSPVVSARTWTVDDDGPADRTSIQAAIDASANSDTVLVMPGTYRESISFRGKGIYVTSSAPEDPAVVASTVVEAPQGSDAFTFGLNEIASSVLQGLTIKGGGIFCNASSPIISQCVIQDCPGAGIEGVNNARPLILGNTITRCTGSGILSCHGSIIENEITYNNGGLAICNGSVTNNLISRNSNSWAGSGGGLYICGGRIENNVITYNSASFFGGGLHQCPGNILNNIISGNQAAWEGAGLWNCSGTIKGNIIAGNRCHDGAGLSDCRGTIVNNIIVGNRAEIGAGLRDCTGSVKNNVIAYNEASEAGGIYGTTSSSYNVYWNNLGGNFGSTAVAGPGDAEADPFFAQGGYWDANGTSELDDDFWVDGDYHVKSKAGRWDPNAEVWVIDDVTSPCVDGGDPASNWKPELWPHGGRINVGVYGGSSQASMSLSPVGSVADLNLDDLVDYSDLALLCGFWLADFKLFPPDLNRDGIVDSVDYAIMVANWRTQPPEPEPPMPDPMTWSVAPHATSHSTIAMEASAAISTDGTSVEYYFEDVHNPEFNSGWIAETVWEDSDLPGNSEFCYHVKARNTGNLLETDWSSTSCATTLPAPPPNPDPMTWASAPAAASWNSVAMTASTATAGDGTGVEYYFANTTIAGHDSGWQGSSTFTDTGLSALTQYSYKVKARNTGNQVETGWSQVSSATTPASDVTPPSPNPMQWAVGGQPKKVWKSPYNSFSWYAEMTAVQATDENGVEYNFICTTESGFNSGWQDSPTYSVHIGPQSVNARFYVIARDKSASRNQTGPSLTLPWQ